jgi:hypothetical protein
MQHVPYRGGGPAVADVIAGHVPAIFLPVTTLGEHVRSGALVALAITSKTRVPVLPDAPTFAESGYPELVMASWFGLSGPKKLSPDIADRVNREARAFLKEPQMRKLAENDASEPLDADPAESPAMWRPKSPAGAKSSGRSISRVRSEGAFVKKGIKPHYLPRDGQSLHRIEVETVRGPAREDHARRLSHSLSL